MKPAKAYRVVVRGWPEAAGSLGLHEPRPAQIETLSSRHIRAMEILRPGVSADWRPKIGGRAIGSVPE